MPYRFSRLLAVTRLRAPHGAQASRPMRPLRQLLLPGALLLAIGGPVHARLAPPTPEQQQTADARKAKEADEAKRQADALSQVQDTIAGRFGKGGSRGSAITDPGKISQKAAEASGTAGPHGSTTPSAEAHSGEAARH